MEENALMMLLHREGSSAHVIPVPGCEVVALGRAQPGLTVAAAHDEHLAPDHRGAAVAASDAHGPCAVSLQGHITAAPAHPVIVFEFPASLQNGVLITFLPLPLLIWRDAHQHDEGEAGMISCGAEAAPASAMVPEPGVYRCMASIQLALLWPPSRSTSCFKRARA